jgi:hypothetical protein
MAKCGFREPGLLERLDAHLPHEGADMASADLVTFVPECIPDPPRPQVRLVQMDPVDETHEFSVLVIDQNRYVVDARPGEVEYPCIVV